MPHTGALLTIPVGRNDTSRRRSTTGLEAVGHRPNPVTTHGWFVHRTGRLSLDEPAQCCRFHTLPADPVRAGAVWEPSIGVAARSPRGSPRAAGLTTRREESRVRSVVGSHTTRGRRSERGGDGRSA